MGSDTIGLLGETRTHGLDFRKVALYPLSYEETNLFHGHTEQCSKYDGAIQCEQTDCECSLLIRVPPNPRLLHAFNCITSLASSAGLEPALFNLRKVVPFPLGDDEASDALISSAVTEKISGCSASSTWSTGCLKSTASSEIYAMGAAIHHQAKVIGEPVKRNVQISVITMVQIPTMMTAQGRIHRIVAGQLGCTFGITPEFIGRHTAKEAS